MFRLWNRNFFPKFEVIFGVFTYKHVNISSACLSRIVLGDFVQRYKAQFWLYVKMRAFIY